MQIIISKADVIWSYLGTIMTLSSQVVMLPLVVYFLDGDMLGLWYVFVSLGAVANLFDFGFTITFSRNIAYCWSGAKSLKKTGADFVENSEPDYVLMKKILNACKLIYFIISILVLMLLLSVGTYYINYISRDIKDSTHIWSWIIYAVSVFLNIYYSYYDSFLKGVGAIKDSNRNKVIARSIHLILMTILLLSGFGILGASIAYLSYGFIFRYLGKQKFYKYKGIGENLNKVKDKFNLHDYKSLFSVIWHNAWREGFIQVSIYCCDQVSVIICSLYLTLTETGVYSLCVQIATAISTIAAVMYSTYQPALQVAYVNNDKIRMRTTMATIVVMYVLIFLEGLILVILAGIPLLSLIKPEMTISITLLLAVSMNQFILKFRNCFTSYFSCTNRIIYTKAFVFSALLCLFLSFFFMGVLHYGVWGLVAAQVVSQTIYNLWYWPYKANKELNLSFCSTVNIGVKTLVKRIKIRK